MELRNRDRELNPLNTVFQMVQNMESHLVVLIEETYKIGISYTEGNENSSKDIIFNNSKEIKQLVDEVLEHIRLNQKLEKVPLIYRIYESNDRVKAMCNGKIDPAKISKQDVAWLVALENEVYKNIAHKEIHLADLSYNLAVSKRQLNRKVQGLLNITPNKYIRVLKMYRAKQLIDEYRYDMLSEVSYAVGYTDTHYFSKLFLQQYGATPKDLLDAKKW